MREGVVIKSTGSWCLVKSAEEEPIACRLRGRIRLDDLKSTNPVAVGDQVKFNLDTQTGEGMIYEICERKNYIIRRATNLSKQTQIIAANIDQAILMVTINYPVTTPVFVDRFLATCEAYNIPAILLFNKIDCYNQAQYEEMLEFKKTYDEIGYKTMEMSVQEQESFDEVEKLFKDKISLISGHSGVGKSTLINRLEPGLDLKTAAISESHLTGRHTTTFAEMHPFSFGGYVIDTPGIRGFGLTFIEKEELYHFFREIFKISSQCQFHNCLHINEPHCAVKKAVNNNEIAPSRYDSYVSIFLDREEKYR